MSNLRSEVIKLAYKKPHLRKELLPLLKKASLGIDDDTLDQIVEMDAEALGLEGGYATPTLKREVMKFNKDWEKFLKNWDMKHPGVIADLDGMLRDGIFLPWMTLRGEGVGIWDGSWDRFMNDKRALSILEKDMERAFRRWSSRLEIAVHDAAMDTAEEY